MQLQTRYISSLKEGRIILMEISSIDVDMFLDFLLLLKEDGHTDITPINEKNFNFCMNLNKDNIFKNLVKVPQEIIILDVFGNIGFKLKTTYV